MTDEHLPRHTLSTGTLASLLAVLLIIVLAIVGWVYRDRLTTLFAGPATTATAQEELLQNPLFAQAETMRKNGTGSPEQIIQLYTNAAETAATPAQKGQTEFLKAVVMAGNGDALSAIQLLKQIAATTDYPPKLRAAAVQEMTIVPHSESKIDNIGKTIFSGQPYSSMLQNDDVYGAYTNLLRYAAALYPLAISEIKIATRELIEFRINNPSATSTPAAVATDIHARVALADKDIDRMRTDVADKEIVPEALMYRAILIGKLEHAGDASLGTGDAAFQTALAAYAAVNESNALLNYNYALYLAWTKNPDAAKIQKALAPVYSDATYGRATLVSYLTAQKNAVGIQKSNIAHLAQYDPRFGTLLSSLGWSAADLSSDAASNS